MTPQEKEGVRTVRKINKDQAKIDFSKPVAEIINLVRGMNPAPIAFTELEGNKINIYRAEKGALTEEEISVYNGAQIGEVLSDKPKRGFLVKCLDGAVKFTEVQASGGKRISGNDFINGRKAQKGQILC